MGESQRQSKNLENNQDDIKRAQIYQKERCSKKWSVRPAEVESRTQSSRPKPRTKKKSEAEAKDRLFED